jgi:eukaryotic-like serine/threonine-protein kinase
LELQEMSTKLGHFEILSELAKSATGFVYKANDPESGQTVALKAIQLSAFGANAAALEKALLAEAETTKVLSSPNITNVYGAGEMEGKFCAAMEYVQGNSIATMLARKEGFSIWDLLDIGRQLCNGIDHAASHNVFHRSLEPSKIMCGWDGTIKILSYGISSVGDFVHFADEGLSSILHYMSPEQVRGEAMDVRSNLFSLGAMFYEMVTERRAFDRDDIESLRQSILESTPVAPGHVSPKIHPLLSDLIMKSLAKDPAERYQTGRALLDDLEKCKESKPAAAKKAEPAKGLNIPKPAKQPVQSKAVSTKAVAPGSSTPRAVQKPAAPAIATAKAQAKPASKPAPKAAAAAAGIGSNDHASTSSSIPEIDLTGHVGGNGSESPSAYMSSAVLDEPQIETFEPGVAEPGPKITVDPTMAEDESGGSKGTSFSEISELPPLKEVYVAPPPPPPVSYQPKKQAAPAVTMFDGAANDDEKPKVQPREVAEKAIKEIKSVPPRLMLYALAGAGLLILLIGAGMTIYIHNLGSEDDPGATRKPVVEQSAPQPQPSQSAPQTVQPPAQETPAPVAAAPVEDETPDPVATGKPAASAKSRNLKKKSAAPAIIPGQIAVDSTPQGAQVEIDGKTDASWVTPFSLGNIQPGQHTVTISKAGYVTDTRTLDVSAGNRATASVHLTQLTATLIVKSDPPGASIYVDGHDVGTKTPAQVSVAKGQHLVLVRLSGYLDETMNGQFTLGQSYNFAPALRALGNVDSIKTVGKMSKFFGGKGDPNQATLSIRTQPKGAQITLNQRMLDKGSPVDVALDPGNYVIDITMTGYTPVHKVISAEKKGKLVIDEVLQPQ